MFREYAQDAQDAAPIDYVAARGLDKEALESFCSYINKSGAFAAIVRDNEVVLPGPCVRGTQLYMLGFYHAWRVAWCLEHGN